MATVHTMHHACSNHTALGVFQLIVQSTLEATHHYCTDERDREDVADLELEWRIDDVLVVRLRRGKTVEEGSESREIVAGDIRDHEDWT